MCISLAFLDRSRSYQTCHQTHKSHAAEVSQFIYSGLMTEEYQYQICNVLYHHYVLSQFDVAQLFLHSKLYIKQHYDIVIRHPYLLHLF